jgi:heme exporter protein A
VGSSPAVRTTRSENLLEVTQLHLWRGDRHLLKGLDFTLDGGQLLQLLWPNGTGKTSLLRCLAGFTYAEEGQVRWEGRRVAEDRDEFHWQLAYLGHENALKDDLTALENLRFSCALRAHLAPAQLQDSLAAVGLASIDPQLPVRNFSAGQKRRVALARLSLWGARLWLLDEPATNLDAAGQTVFTGLLQQHLANGGAAIVATHRRIEVSGVKCRYWNLPAEPLQ